MQVNALDKGRGARLSNAWLTYPRDGDNPGKLGLIPDRWEHLEWAFI